MFDSLKAFALMALVVAGSVSAEQTRVRVPPGARAMLVKLSIMLPGSSSGVPPEEQVLAPEKYLTTVSPDGRVEIRWRRSISQQVAANAKVSTRCRDEVAEAFGQRLTPPPPSASGNVTADLWYRRGTALVLLPQEVGLREVRIDADEEVTGVEFLSLSN